LLPCLGIKLGIQVTLKLIHQTPLSSTTLAEILHILGYLTHLGTANGCSAKLTQESTCTSYSTTQLLPNGGRRQRALHGSIRILPLKSITGAYAVPLA
jgi:hypothetical protein